MITKEQAQLIANSRGAEIADFVEYHDFHGALLCINVISADSVEAHICIPPRLVRHAVRLCNEMLQYMTGRGFRQCLTNVTGSAVSAKLCHRLGFEPITAYNDVIVFRRLL